MHLPSGVWASALPAEAPGDPQGGKEVPVWWLRQSLQDEGVSGSTPPDPPGQGVQLQPVWLQLLHQCPHPHPPPAAQRKQRHLWGMRLCLQRPCHLEETQAGAWRGTALPLHLPRLHLAVQVGSDVPSSFPGTHNVRPFCLPSVQLRLPPQAPPPAPPGESSWYGWCDSVSHNM